MQSEQFVKALKVCNTIIEKGYRHPQIYMLMAIALGNTDKLRESKEIFSGLIRDFPENAELYYNFGLVLSSNNDNKSALRQYLQVLKLNPNHIHAHVNTGNIYYSQNNFNAAISHYQSARNLQPGNPEYIRSLAKAYYAVNKHLEAIQLLTPLVQQNFADSSDYFIVADSMYKSRENTKAYQTCNRALLLFPDNPEILNLIGLIEIDEKKYNSARNHIRMALKFKPGDTEYQMALINAESHIESRETILRNLSDLVKNNENNISVLRFAARICENIASLSEAADYIEMGLKLKANDAEVLYQKAELCARKNDPESALVLLNHAKKQNIDTAMSVKVHYLFAKIYDKQNDYKQAWNSITLANSEQSARLPGNTYQQDYILQCSQLKNDLKNYQITEFPDSAAHIKLIFIVGFPRSGTTLIEKILAAHPDVKVLEETNAINEIFHEINQKNDSFFKLLSSLDKKQLDKYAKDYLNKLSEYTQRDKSDTIIDKMPMNGNHLALIKTLFPHAKIIFAIRHPADVCLSCLMQDMLQLFSFKSAAAAYCAYMELIDSYLSQLKPDYFSLKYEDLIENKNQTLNQLLKYIELNRHENMDTFYESHKPVNTPSYQQVSQPIYDSSKFRYSHYLPFIAEDMVVLEPWIKKFKYITQT